MYARQRDWMALRDKLIKAIGARRHWRHSRLFGTSGACSGCGQMIPANDYVMRAAQNVYHVKCFACVKCHSQLVPGDRYNLVNGNVLCEQDCLKMLKGSPATVRKGKVRAAIKV
ncbi:hypothetical protein V5799_027882 [Amblyomma americanum]|uniref:LIM zinc-binding domain-containing protein n=1 Tax=Amblyomma americanum TaxID=6943 RepID=A0AAQ4DEG1_AMBAM